MKGASAFAEGMRQQMFCIVYFRGGRGSTAAQPTNRELAPDHAAGKVPVSWGEHACDWGVQTPVLSFGVEGIRGWGGKPCIDDH